MDLKSQDFVDLFFSFKYSLTVTKTSFHWILGNSYYIYYLLALRVISLGLDYTVYELVLDPFKNKNYFIT